MKSCHRYTRFGLSKIQTKGGTTSQLQVCLCAEVAVAPRPSEVRAKRKASEEAFKAKVDMVHLHKAEMKCRLFEDGKCARTGNKKCAFLHPGDPALIKCELPKRPDGSGRCKVESCQYYHAEPSTTAMTECKYHDPG